MKHSSQFRNGKLIWLLFTISIVVVWISSCGQPGSVTPVTEEPPTATPTSELTQAPDRQKCEGGDGKYICMGDREITLEGVPTGVTPYLLPIDPAFRDFLVSAESKKDGTTCVFMLAGDLAFYDEGGTLINGFDTPVTIKYSYLGNQDDEAFKKCQEEASATATPEVATEDVKYVPVYYHQEVWRPFKDAVVDTETGIMTITFTSWGDQPIGGGSQP